MMADQTICNGHVPRRRSPTAHDWAAERHGTVCDDGTMTFFWRTHTLLTLFMFATVLCYVTFFEQPRLDSNLNTKRGVTAVVLVFLLFGVAHTPDGPFRRPHPALWRFVFCASIVYELALIFILFQSVDDARLFMRHFDSELGKPLEERDYGGNCAVYDTQRPDDPFHNIKEKLDGFVIAHFLGWWAKSLMFRDYWLCMVQSVLFEALEYSLEHQLPNFSECWWDHWICDALVCNCAGIYVGMKTCRYLNMKSYNWRGMWSIPTLKGKMQRVAQQFTPYSWMDFDWRPLQSLQRWAAVLGIIFVVLVAELNFFYLKYILWLPPPHYINSVRLLLMLLAGTVATRETFQFLDDPVCKQFGRQSWMILAIVITEFLVIAKFGSETIKKPLPYHVLICWLVFGSVILGWTIWKFFVWPYILQPWLYIPNKNQPCSSDSDSDDSFGAALLSFNEGKRRKDEKKNT